MKKKIYAISGDLRQELVDDFHMLYMRCEITLHPDRHGNLKFYYDSGKASRLEGNSFQDEFQAFRWFTKNYNKLKTTKGL